MCKQQLIILCWSLSTQIKKSLWQKCQSEVLLLPTFKWHQALSWLTEQVSKGFILKETGAYLLLDSSYTLNGWVLKYYAPFSLLLRLLAEAIMKQYALILTDHADLNSLERTYPATRVNLEWNKPATQTQAWYHFNNGRVGQGSWFSPS